MTDLDGWGLSGIEVIVSDAYGLVIDSRMTDTNGRFAIPGLRADAPTVVFAGDLTMTYDPQFYDGAITFDSAERVSVPGGGVTDITIAMAPFGSTTLPPEVGLVDISQGIWYLRTPDGGTNSFFYGNPGDLPIAGDWDGDGIATPGLYRQSDGFFYARNSNTQGPADAECFAGDPADVPIAGDWDGDGDDNLGIYRPSEQKFYLFTSTCTGSPMGAAQIELSFGNPGDKPVAGDWDADGIDEIGLHRETTGFFYWRNTLDTGIASGEIFFGDPGDRFISGDWGLIDGIDTPAIYRPSDTTFYFRHTLSEGIADSVLTTDLGPTWLPVSGVFTIPGRSLTVRERARTDDSDTYRPNLRTLR